MPETPPTSTAPRQEDDMPRDPPLSIPEVQGFPPLIETAKADLAQRLSISASQVNVLEVQEVTWPDGSLGCPQPGNTYTQALIPGYRILLESNGNTSEYHTNLRDSVF